MFRKSPVSLLQGFMIHSVLNLYWFCHLIVVMTGLFKDLKYIIFRKSCEELSVIRCRIVLILGKINIGKENKTVFLKFSQTFLMINYIVNRKEGSILSKWIKPCHFPTKFNWWLAFNAAESFINNFFVAKYFIHIWAKD